MSYYKMYHPIKEQNYTLGQSWHNETVEQSMTALSERSITSFTLKWLPKNGVTLEAGCGMGTWVIYLRDLGYTILGIDSSEEGLKKAIEYDSNAQVFCADVTNLGFPDNAFSGITCFGLLEHFENGKISIPLGELKRVLKSNGILVVSIPINNWHRSLVANRLKEFKRFLNKLRGAQYAFEEYRYTVKEFSKILEDNEFRILECKIDEGLGHKHMGLTVDYPFLRKRGSHAELNVIGRLIRIIVDSISPWFIAGAAVWACENKK